MRDIPEALGLRTVRGWETRAGGKRPLQGKGRAPASCVRLGGGENREGISFSVSARLNEVS